MLVMLVAYKPTDSSHFPRRQVSDPTLFGRAAERLVLDTGATGMLQTQAESVELELKNGHQVLGVDLRFGTYPTEMLGFETQKSVDIYSF